MGVGATWGWALLLSHSSVHHHHHHHSPLSSAALSTSKLHQSKQAFASAPLVLAAKLTSAPGDIKPLTAKAAAWATGKRAIVVFQGGDGTHAFTGPTADPACQCAQPRPPFVEALLAAGFPVFTAPAFVTASLTQGGVSAVQTSSTAGETGCPPQPPLDAQWDANGWPTAVGHAGLNFLGWLAASYGYRHFDIVGYSYGGIVGRATISALKAASAGDAGAGAGAAAAPGFSYAAYAAAVGVTIPSLITMNTPKLSVFCLGREGEGESGLTPDADTRGLHPRAAHRPRPHPANTHSFGSPSYDIAAVPTTYPDIVSTWGPQYAELSKGLILAGLANAGALQFLTTLSHTDTSAQNGYDWDVTQVGALDGVAVTLLWGDYCGFTGCGATPPTGPLTDGTVGLYSQLMLACGEVECGSPPYSLYVPPGLVPPGTVRKVFPTVHSSFVTKALADLTGQQYPATLSVDKNPDAIAFIVDTVAAAWRAAGVPVLG